MIHIQEKYHAKLKEYVYIFNYPVLMRDHVSYGLFMVDLGGFKGLFRSESEWCMEI